MPVGVFAGAGAGVEVAGAGVEVDLGGSTSLFSGDCLLLDMLS